MGVILDISHMIQMNLFHVLAYVALRTIGDYESFN